MSRRYIEAAPPNVDTFRGISATFLRGDGTEAHPTRQCTAYWRIGDDDELHLLAVYDPNAGIDPVRFPPVSGPPIGASE